MPRSGDSDIPQPRRGIAVFGVGSTTRPLKGFPWESSRGSRSGCARSPRSRRAVRRRRPPRRRSPHLW
ncbi:hypothetical protein [Alloactinosynnema sp. L-07]|nr:hypothetical protein [Alloactinosynnema sp. L-07]